MNSSHSASKASNLRKKAPTTNKQSDDEIDDDSIDGSNSSFDLKHQIYELNSRINSQEY